jgi:uncharacterized protein (TIGR02246 family)
MNRHGLILAVVLAVGAAVVVAARRDQLPAQEKAALAAPAVHPPSKVDSAEAGIKAITAEYQKAFNTADAKAAAALWTAEGEYIAADGEVAKGRDAIEKGLAAFFKANPKATAEIQVESIRAIGRGTATAEGVVQLKTPGDDMIVESRYSALHVLEDGKWHAASVKEWVPDPATVVAPKHLDWLVGEWVAKGEGGEVKIVYAWDENKVFLNAKYTITKDRKVVSSGTQVFGRNHAGGVRTWTFDSSGTTCEGLWVRDDKRWINEAVGVLPDGTEITSLNIIIPLGPDAFTWQTTDRAADGVPLPALSPVKVTRVKK